jgi:hypothetical protein
MALTPIREDVMPTTPTPTDVKTLRAGFSGPIVTPGGDGWDSARQAWNLAVDQHPALVAYATSPEDVEAALGFARTHGLRVAVQGTGHFAAALGALDDTLLLKTMRMGGVEIDTGSRRARVEAGVLMGDLAVKAGEHGLAPLSGSSPDVSVVGFTLGGGLGWLGREHGFACNAVEAIELVTADGRQVRADRESEPDLFWALRGGGGSFGVVTAITIRLLPLEEVFAGSVFYDAADGVRVLPVYRDWARGAPREVSSSVRYICLPPLPEVPEPLRARPLVGITAAHSGEDAAETLRPLREAARVVADSFGSTPAAGLCRIHGDPEQPVPGITDHSVLAELDDEAIDALVEVAGPDAGSPLLQVDLRHLGGALSEPAPSAGVLSDLPGEFAVSAVGVPMAPGSAERIEAHLGKVKEALAPHSTGRGYLNFAERGDRDRCFDGDMRERLRAIRTDVDPDRMLHAGFEA